MNARLVRAPELAATPYAHAAVTDGTSLVLTAGARLEDVVRTTVYVVAADRADLVDAWHAVSSELGDHDPPSTLLGVTVLGYPDQLVEIDGVAVRASEPG